MIADGKIDHLFRHEYGKMVSSLIRIYGVQHLELIEDAVQDTFHKAVLYFRNHPLPDSLEAWLRTAVKNRAIDLFRKASTSRKYEQLSGPGFMSMSEVFTDQEIEDSQLRLLFTVCHPSLKPKDQIIFALKTFSGFSIAEIGNAMLLDKENIKKTLQRARKQVRENQLEFAVPVGDELNERLSYVHLAIYLLFNEGFHSSSKDQLIRKDLVAEALRLNDLLLERFQHSDSSALMALMCFHAARLNAKIDDDGNLIRLKYQDRTLWNYQLVWKGHIHMENAVKTDQLTKYHYEAAIAGEYVRSEGFDDINWDRLEDYYLSLIGLNESPFHLLNLAVIRNQKGNHKAAKATLKNIDLKKIKGKEHLYFTVLSEIELGLQNFSAAMCAINSALDKVSNASERKLIEEKRAKIIDRI